LFFFIENISKRYKMPGIEIPGLITVSYEKNFFEGLFSL